MGLVRGLQVRMGERLPGLEREAAQRREPGRQQQSDKEEETVDGVSCSGSATN